MFQRAEQAAQLWPLTVNTLGLAAHRENAVFKLEAEEGTFALRLHRTGYRDFAELEAELAFMAMLASTGIAVPALSEVGVENTLNCRRVSTPAC